ncbi:MAG: hypothetical protein ACREQB_08860, partial [Candidatus Binataceae bacterium]
MIDEDLKEVESIRVVRADANLRLIGGAEITLARCDRPPTVSRIGGVAEVSFEANAELRLRPGVIVEIKDCGGDLEIDDVVTPLTIESVGGNLRASGAGAVTV